MRSSKNTAHSLQTQPSRILGIDPGTRKVGYAIIDSLHARNLVYIECGLLELPVEQSITTRLGQLYAHIEEIITEFQPNICAIEQAYYGQNASSTLKLAEARGVIKAAAHRKGLAVYEYSPARIKRMVTGRGRANKHEVIQRVQWLCGLERPPQSDAADALAIAICHTCSPTPKEVPHDRMA